MGSSYKDNQNKLLTDLQIIRRNSDVIRTEPTRTRLELNSIKWAQLVSNSLSSSSSNIISDSIKNSESKPSFLELDSINSNSNSTRLELELVFFNFEKYIDEFVSLCVILII